jgi:uncharacterized RDD family membrane protein YckC
MFCSKCGKANADGAISCAQCGTRMGAASASIGAAAVTGVTYAGFWKRYLALMLDYVILWIFIGIAGALIGASAPSNEALLGLLNLASILLFWLYFALLESSGQQATYGKKVMGIQVTDGQGNRISFARASGRFFGKILSGIILCIGYIMAAFTPRKQALHDLMADCVVVNKSPPSMLAIILAALIGLTPVIGILAAIALPAYQDYTIRAKVMEVVMAGKEATLAVDRFMSEQNALPASMEETGFKPTSQYMDNITIDRYGVIEISVNIASIEDGVIVFSPLLAQDPAWDCGGENIDVKYLPVECR